MKKLNVTVATMILGAVSVFWAWTGHLQNTQAQGAPIPIVDKNVSDSSASFKNLFIDLDKKVNPAVVNISTTQTTQLMRGFGNGLGDPMQGFLEQWMGPGQFQQFRTRPQKIMSLGSGFIIDASGLIITNNHVIQNASDIQVQLTEKSKKTYKATVIGHDEKSDLAVIKITTDQKLPVVSLGDSDKVERGEWVMAFGNPLGHGHSISKGIISATDREIDLDQNYVPFLQTDANINPGNSGGPLVNTEGLVIGVNSAIDPHGQGIGFAIPINVVKKLLPALESKGKISRGFLGVSIGDINEEIMKNLKISTDKGAFVMQVTYDSPASHAGLQSQDIITEFNGVKIESARNLSSLVSDTPGGKEVQIKALRKNRILNLSVQIGELPDQKVTTAEIPYQEGE